MDDPQAPQPMEAVPQNVFAVSILPPVPARSQPPPKPPQANLFRWVYTHNPFYVLSAALVFWGLRSSFDTGRTTFDSLALLIALLGYTVLLAVTTFLVIRFGKVWQDGRSQLLLIVLMFLAISVSFDDAIALNPQLGNLCCLAGLLFAVVVSEGLLLGLPLRLPALFRVPYYLILALFFLAPIVLYPFAQDPYDPTGPWALLAFPAVAGVIFLLLLPAIRRGAAYVEDNGSPWHWPLYPWVLFVLLGLGVCQRSYYLCVSMHHAGGMATIFGPYFLVPFLLAANILLLEIGLVSRSVAARCVAMLAPVGLLGLAMIPVTGSVALRFLAMFAGTLGTWPPFLALIAVCVFYGWAFLRRVPLAAEALSAAVIATSVIGPATRDLATFTAPQAIPFLLAGVLEGVANLRPRNSARCLFAACCVIAALAIELQGTPFMACQGAIPKHLVLLAALVIGAVFRDAFAKFLQGAGAVAIFLAAMAVMRARGTFPGIPETWLTVYPLLAVVVAAAYGYLVRNRSYYVAAACTLCWWVILWSGWVYVFLRRLLPGLNYIAWGMVSFLVAVFISLLKMGLPQRWLEKRRTAISPTRSCPPKSERAE